MYMTAGLSVGSALEAMSEKMPKKRCLSLLRIKDSVESGQSLSSALTASGSFPLSLIGLIACGEESGSLAKTLQSCHSLLEREDDLARKCLSAMAYPIIIGIATAILTIGLVEGVMPQIIPLLSGLHSDLPLLTRIVIAVSAVCTRYGVVMFVAALLASAILAILYKKVLLFRAAIHVLVMNIPVMGGLVVSYSLAIFFHSFGSMVEAGMSVTDAYDKASSSFAVIPLRKRFKKKLMPLIRGEPMHSIVDKSMPQYVGSIIRAGEASGNLGHALVRAAMMLDKDIDRSLKRLTSMLEPALMMGMGSAVGSIALSIMLPIYDISKALQR